jgi:hypothetical protein
MALHCPRGWWPTKFEPHTKGATRVDPYAVAYTGVAPRSVFKNDPSIA